MVVGKSCGEKACAGVVKVGRSKPLAKIDQLGGRQMSQILLEVLASNRAYVANFGDQSLSSHVPEAGFWTTSR